MYGSIVKTSFVTSLDDDEGQWSLYIVYNYTYLFYYRHLYNLYSWFCVHYLLIIIKPYDIWFWSYLVVRIHSSYDHIHFFRIFLWYYHDCVWHHKISCVSWQIFPGTSWDDNLQISNMHELDTCDIDRHLAKTFIPPAPVYSLINSESFSETIFPFWA